MNSTSLEEIYRAKQDRRSELAALPAEEKLRIMEKLRDMGQSMIAARDESKPVISDQHFEGREVVLDSKYFVRCAFKNCTIKILGTMPFGLTGCTFETCQFAFADAAQLNLQLLSMMYHNGFKDLVESVFESVRLAEPPRIPWDQGQVGR